MYLSLSLSLSLSLFLYLSLTRSPIEVSAGQLENIASPFLSICLTSFAPSQTTIPRLNTFPFFFKNNLIKYFAVKRHSLFNWPLLRSSASEVQCM